MGGTTMGVCTSRSRSGSWTKEPGNGTSQGGE